ncbi:MAG: TlyA family RNA methyltransferase, partial [Clostridia bacterium]|nr:TlyA family RNA methyltransferase [Clostridia bacterium]
MRIDTYLAENGMAPSRTRASEMIKKGLVTADGKIVTKPSFEV